MHTELAHQSLYKLISWWSPLKRIVNARDFLKNVTNRDRLHAKIVAADRLPIVVGVHARAACDAGPEGGCVRGARGKQRRCLWTKQGDDANRCHGSEMRRAAVVRDQNLAPRIKDEDLTQSCFPGE